MEINNLNKKIVEQLNLALKQLDFADSFNCPNSTRLNINKAQGILETIKNLLEE